MNPAGLIRLMALIWLAFQLSVPAAFAQFGSEPHLQARLISERSQIFPGDKFTIAVEAIPDDGWHFYWKNPGDAGQPPFIEWRRTDGLEVGEFQWPLPERLPVIPGEIMDYGYSDREVLFMTVTAPETLATDSVRLWGDLKYLICKEVCIPEELEISLYLAVGETPERSFHAGALATATADLPLPFSGTARFNETSGKIRLFVQDPALERPGSLDFFPANNEIVHAAEVEIYRDGDQAVLGLTPDPFTKTTETFDGLLVLTDASGERTGFQLSAQSGGVPTLAGDLQVNPSGGSGRSAPSFLIVLGLAFFGGLILNLMPCVLPILSLKAFGIVHAAASGKQGELRAHGIWYTLGVVSTFLAIAAAFVALRATGDPVGLGFQLQEPIAVFVTSLIMFLVGLWLLGMFEFGTSVQSLGSGLAARQGHAGAFFTGGLAAFVGAPCIGPFLAVALGAVVTQPAPNVLLTFAVMGLGMALPFLILSFVPGFQKLLPKPGGWMETLKQFFAFPVFLTALWLVSVLTDQTGTGGAVAALTVMVAIGFAIWLVRQGGAAPLPLGVAAFALIGATAFAVPNLTLRELPKSDLAWSPERVAELVAQGRPVFVDFTASWCVTCQVNKRTTLQNARVTQAFAANNVVLLVADYTNKDDLIGAELRKYESPGVPMYLYYPPGESDPKVLSVVLSPAYVLSQIAES